VKNKFKIEYRKVHTKLSTAEASALNNGIMSIPQIQTLINQWITTDIYIDHTVIVIADSCLLFEIKRTKEGE